MTVRMRDYIREQALQKPFSHIASELDVSVPTIERIFTDYANEMESKRQLIAPMFLLRTPKVRGKANGKNLD